MDSSSSNRWSEVTPNNHAGIIWILSILAGVYTVLTAIIRIFIKRKTWGIDDSVFMVALVTGAGTLATTYDATANGLGMSNFRVSEGQLENISRPLFAGRILLFLTMCLAKCSVALLIRRLFAEDMYARRRVCEVAVAVIAVWGVAAMIGVAAGCNSEHLLDEGNKHCSGQVARWAAISVTEVLLEFVTIGLSFMVIWGIHINNQMKIKVISAFAFRLPTVVTSILNIIYISHYVNSSNPNLNYISAISCQTVHLTVSLFTAVVPNLKSFLMSFDTGEMMKLSARIRGESQFDYEGSGSHGGSKSRPPNGSYPLRPVNSGHNAGAGLGHSTFRQTPSQPAGPSSMIRGGIRTHDRRGNGQIKDSFYNEDDDMDIAPIDKKRFGKNARRDRIDEDDDGSREAPSFGAESQRRMIWRRETP